ncbi:MAG: hypothetical protein H7248_10440 [Microbacteriaceae bacterium]|nr:hypothetical protein [Microbacteriaceae bacterium]
MSLTPLSDDSVAGPASMPGVGPAGDRSGWRRVVRQLFLVVGVFAVLALGSNVTGSDTARADWYASFAAGGTVSTTVASMSAAAAPITSLAGGEVVVSWTPSSFAGITLKSYRVKRYSGGTVQAVSGACSGTITNVGCVETGVPAGTWTYTVTPVLTGTNWTGPESAPSTAVTTTGIAGTNSLWFWVTP